MVSEGDGRWSCRECGYLGPLESDCWCPVLVPRAVFDAAAEVVAALNAGSAGRLNLAAVALRAAMAAADG